MDHYMVPSFEAWALPALCLFMVVGFLGLRRSKPQNPAVNEVAKLLVARLQHHDGFMFCIGGDMLRAEVEPMAGVWWVTVSDGEGKVSDGLMDDAQLEAELTRFLGGWR